MRKNRKNTDWTGHPFSEDKGLIYPHRKSNLTGVDCRELGIPFALNDVMRTSFNRSEWMHHVRYPYLAVEIPLSGSLKCSDENGSTTVFPGELYFIEPGDNMQLATNGDSPCEKISLIFNGALVPQLLVQYHLCNFRKIGPCDISMLLKYISEAEQILWKWNGNRFDLEIASYQVFLEIVRLSQSRMVPDNIFRFESFVHEIGGQYVTVQQIADKLGMTSKTLTRLFLKHYGLPPKQYLLKIRMEIAEKMLTDSNFSIGEIAQKTGYSSSENFATIFRKKTGISPLQYRNVSKVNKKVLK